jgi:hypothetical protein
MFEIGTLPESLEVACRDTCRFRLSLDLQMAAWRRERDEGVEEKALRQKLKQKRDSKQKARAIRKSLSIEDKEALRAELGDKSRLELLQQIVPCGRKGKKSGKASAANKKAKKNKLKMLKTKLAKLQKHKKLEAAKALESEPPPPLPPPPLPPPFQPPSAASSSSPPPAEPLAADSNSHVVTLVGKEFRIVRESEGVIKYGVQGRCTAHNAENDMLHSTLGGGF